jgi:two-component system, OmpR family, phosphate regulon sensor histidine kinase PhoR
MPLFPTTKHIKELIGSLNKILEGSPEQKVTTHSRGEIALLADAINKTITTLQQNISEQKRQNSQIQTILNSMVEGVMAIDLERKIISINPAITRIFDISKQNAEGKFFLEVIRNNDMFDVINSVLEKREFISKELTLLWPTQLHFQLSASPLIENNIIQGCVVVIYDITEIRRLETVRSEFVANVSHELKTPLTSIKGFVETLLEGALEDKQNCRHFLKIIQGHTERLNNLINDLLELSRIESRKIPLEKEEFKLKILVEEILNEYEPQLKERNITSEMSFGADTPVLADKKKLRVALNNLIDNAIKFNKDSGFIHISCETKATHTKVIIEDSGIGIPPEHLERIFERFYRVDRGRSRELGGTGLGLSIVKHIIELHGGSIGIESVEGVGSKLFFLLPKA